MSLSVKRRMRRPGLPEGHSNAKVTGHRCSCLLRRLTSRIGGWSDGKRNDRKERCSRQGVEDFADAVGQSWQQIRAAQVLWGSERRAFRIWRGVKRPDANFAEVSATREGRSHRAAKDKSTPPPNNSESFSSFSSSPFLSPTQKTPRICFSTRCDSL